MRDLYSVTGQELVGLPRDRTVIIFALGGLSDHGPHLPVGLDWIEAQALAHEVGSRIEARPSAGGLGPWIALLAPALPFTATGPARRGLLSLHGRAPAIRDALVDACRGLKRSGFRYFLAISGDLGPRQLCAIEDAGRRIGRGNWRRGPSSRVVFASVCSSFTRPADAWKAITGRRAHRVPGGERDLAIARALVPQWVGAAAPTVSSRISGEALLREQVNEAWPKILACLEQGANPRLLFQSWYSVIPWYRSTFTAWVLVFAVLLLAAVLQSLE